MQKRTFIKYISFCLAGVVVALGLWIGERSKAQKYRLELQNQYSAALSELNTRIHSIQSVLQKAEYVSSAERVSSYAAELYSSAELAKSALSNLPSGGGQLQTIYKFLSQVGNFALSVSKSVIAGNPITTEQHTVLKELMNATATVATAVDNAQVSLNNAENWADEISRLTDSALQSGALAASLTETEEDLSDYPKLIYDGPYSDHILSETPKMLSDAPEVTKTEAFTVAHNLIENREQLSFADNERGKIPAYVFKGDSITAAITVSGGYPLYMRKDRAVKSTKLTAAEAAAKAKAFLLSNGFKNMIDTYYFTDNGICVINFAYLDGQTVCYTDLIKVGVAMDNGEIMLLEASGYLSRHTARAFETPAFTSDDAAAKVSPELTVESTALALIPTDGGGEVRCYEFLCAAEKGEEILIYINTQTLKDEEVFILLETEGGTLVK